MSAAIRRLRFKKVEPAANESNQLARRTPPFLDVAVKHVNGQMS